jgi:hypothetical protein
MVSGHCKLSTTFSTPLASPSSVVVLLIRTESPSHAAVRAQIVQIAARSSRIKQFLFGLYPEHLGRGFQ